MPLKTMCNWIDNKYVDLSPGKNMLLHGNKFPNSDIDRDPIFLVITISAKFRKGCIYIYLDVMFIN